ncbi:MAG: hypothetical protein ACJ76V_00440 [Thermoleophilaceae bacterium]
MKHTLTSRTITTALAVGLFAIAGSAQARPDVNQPQSTPGGSSAYVLPHSLGAELSSGHKNYSQNSITGAYTEPKSLGAELSSGHKNYSQNSITGAYTPPKATPVALVRVVKQDSGFQWADAAAGAGIALGLMLLLGTGVAAVRRHRTNPPLAAS